MLIEKVSLVVPVLNEAETICALIATIDDQLRAPDEVIFVDGGSRDGTIDLLRSACQKRPGFRLIQIEKGSPGKGRNIGAANAIHDWIAFTDAGICLERDWLAQLIAAAESDAETGIVCGNFDPMTNTFFTDCAAVAYIDAKVARENGACRGPSIASALVRRDVWQAVGGFPDLRASEDLIFFEDVERRGYKFKWAPKATVHFQLQPNLWSTFRRFRVYSMFNVWAQRQHKWHYGVARLYCLSLPFLVLAVWKSWWLLIPPAGLCARVARRIWMRRENHPTSWVLNPARFGYVLIITLALDMATFVGWIQALVKRDEARRIKLELAARNVSAVQVKTDKLRSN